MRKFPARQLLSAEDEMTALQRWIGAVGIKLGEASDAIHWDGAEPPACDGLLDEIVRMQVHLDRAAGLVRAYEIHRRAAAVVREVGNDDASAR